MKSEIAARNEPTLPAAVIRQAEILTDGLPDFARLERTARSVAIVAPKSASEIEFALQELEHLEAHSGAADALLRVAGAFSDQGPNLGENAAIGEIVSELAALADTFAVEQFADAKSWARCLVSAVTEMRPSRIALGCTCARLRRVRSTPPAVKDVVRAIEDEMEKWGRFVEAACDFLDALDELRARLEAVE